MTALRTVDIGGTRVSLADGVEEIGRGASAKVIVCGDAASLRVARKLLRTSPRFVALHDAGVGKDAAGIAGLERLADMGVAAVAVDHGSARIGDADDVLANGKIAHMNDVARNLGFHEGPLRAQLGRLAPASLATGAQEEQVA